MTADLMTGAEPTSALGPDLVGKVFEPVLSSWTSRDCSLYALGIGAGQDDPLSELEFTTDNTRGRPQVVYPTFAVVAGCPAGIAPLLSLMEPHADLRLMLHGEQSVRQLRPLPTAAAVRTTAQLSAIWDKGTSTIVETTSEIRDADTDEMYASTTQSLFFRGVGGWGGERGPSGTAPATPARAPDVVLRAPTRPDQALLYRLSGDTNPLHSDPALAVKAGFARPILHGLCTYGVVGRVLLGQFAGAEPARLESMSSRFRAPTMPGDALTINTWTEADRVIFIVTNDGGDVLIDNGCLRLGS